MTLEYHVSFDDFLEARRLLCYTQRKGQDLRLFRWIFPVIGLLFIAFVLFQIIGHRADFGSMFFLLLFGLYCLYIPLLIKRRLRRSYLAQRVGEETRIAMSDSGLQLESADGIEKNDWHWPMFEQALESNSIFMLVLRNAHFLIIPKNSLDTGRIHELRTILRHQFSNFQQVK